LKADNNNQLIQNLAYTKVKELQLSHLADTQTIRIKFNLRTIGVPVGVKFFGRIFKNDVAFGTERFITSTGGVDDFTFSEDLMFTTNDFLQLYVHTDTLPNLGLNQTFTVSVSHHHYIYYKQEKLNAIQSKRRA